MTNEFKVQSFSLVDPDELSNRLRVPKSWIYAKTREIGPNTIPRIKVGKYLRFDVEEVMRWLKRTNN